MNKLKKEALKVIATGMSPGCAPSFRHVEQCLETLNP